MAINMGNLIVVGVDQILDATIVGSLAVRVAMAVCCAGQHATPHSTAQHPCALQHNTSQV